jgi:hypothetical protein
MSKYQTDEVYRNKVKKRNKEFQKCMREDSRRMDWLRAAIEEKAEPDVDFLKAIVANDKYGDELPNGKKRRPDFEYCATDDEEEEEKEEVVADGDGD